MKHAGVSVGDPLTAETVKRLDEAARTIDEHFSVEYKKLNDGIVLMILAR